MNTVTVGACGQCGTEDILCKNCHNCVDHCHCWAHRATFDADELGLDPETDNTPDTGSRHA